jgi:hypothetical protein
LVLDSQKVTLWFRQYNSGKAIYNERNKGLRNLKKYHSIRLDEQWLRFGEKFRLLSSPRRWIQALVMKPGAVA